MQMIHAPNRWSCLPCAFAMALDETFEEMIFHLNHDGSEIIRPDMPEPLCRKAFDVNELLQVAIQLGYGFIALPKPPDKLKAVLLGETKNGVPHAVAWTGNRVYDPAGGRYPLSDFRWDACLVPFNLSAEGWETIRLLAKCR